MALEIAEFPASLSHWSTNSPSVAKLPDVLANQSVAIGVGSASSSALNAGTRIVMLTPDAACRVVNGPTADATSVFLAANQVYVFEVDPAKLISVIAA